MYLNEVYLELIKCGTKKHIFIVTEEPISKAKTDYTDSLAKVIYVNSTFILNE